MNDDDDIQLQSYQDDLTTDDNATDPVMEEEGEDPSEELGVPPEELKAELDKNEIDGLPEDALDEDDQEREDREAYLEDLDEDIDERE